MKVTNCDAKNVRIRLVIERGRRVVHHRHVQVVFGLVDQLDLQNYRLIKVVWITVGKIIDWLL